MRAERQEWHLVTCEYPPTIGGVGDYSATVAAGLAADGHDVHVWCPAAAGAVPDIAGVIVHRELGRFGLHSIRRVGRLLNQRPAPRRLFVQWVPHGFGYHSINVPFAAWLAGRAWLCGDEVHVMVHEPYLRFSRNLLHSVAAILHRVMLMLLGSGARRIWLSTPAWSPDVRPYVPAACAVDWLPVPVPPLPDPAESVLQALRQSWAPSGQPTVGHFSSHSPILTPVLRPAIERLLDASSAMMVLIGHDGERLRGEIVGTRPDLALRIRATGDLDRASLAAAVGACDVMLQPYPDGVSARRTSTLTLLARGCAVVTNSGHRTEDFWAGGAVVLVPGADPSAIARAAIELTTDGHRRADLGRHAHALYERVFDVRNAVSALRISAASAAPRAAHPLASPR